MGGKNSTQQKRTSGQSPSGQQVQSSNLRPVSLVSSSATDAPLTGDQLHDLVAHAEFLWNHDDEESNATQGEGKKKKSKVGFTAHSVFVSNDGPAFGGRSKKNAKKTATAGGKPLSAIEEKLAAAARTSVDDSDADGEDDSDEDGEHDVPGSPLLYWTSQESKNQQRNRQSKMAEAVACAKTGPEEVPSTGRDARSITAGDTTSAMPSATKRYYSHASSRTITSAPIPLVNPVHYLLLSNLIWGLHQNHQRGVKSEGEDSEGTQLPLTDVALTVVFGRLLAYNNIFELECKPEFTRDSSCRWKLQARRGFTVRLPGKMHVHHDSLTQVLRASGPSSGKQWAANVSRIATVYSTGAPLVGPCVENEPSLQTAIGLLGALPQMHELPIVLTKRCWMAILVAAARADQIEFLRYFLELRPKNPLNSPPLFSRASSTENLPVFSLFNGVETADPLYRVYREARKLYLKGCVKKGDGTDEDEPDDKTYHLLSPHDISSILFGAASGDNHRCFYYLVRLAEQNGHERAAVITASQGNLNNMASVCVSCEAPFLLQDVLVEHHHALKANISLFVSHLVTTAAGFGTVRSLQVLALLLHYHFPVEMRSIVDASLIGWVPAVKMLMEYVLRYGCASWTPEKGDDGKVIDRTKATMPVGSSVADFPYDASRTDGLSPAENPPPPAPSKITPKMLMCETRRRTPINAAIEEERTEVLETILEVVEAYRREEMAKVLEEGEQLRRLKELTSERSSREELPAPREPHSLEHILSPQELLLHVHVGWNNPFSARGTELHHALKRPKHHLPSIKAMLKYDTDCALLTRATDSVGNTPFHYAVLHFSVPEDDTSGAPRRRSSAATCNNEAAGVETLEVLLKFGGNPLSALKMKNNDGETPLNLAVAMKATRAVQMIKDVLYPKQEAEDQTN